jgi:AhpD family alkylhydroperoxidase
MSTLTLIDDAHASPAVRAIFDDIRATRGTDYINNFWRALANDPAELARTWHAVKAVMVPGALDALTKEYVYIAVSAANACAYCVHSHTAAARAKGMSAEQHGELLAVIALAHHTNGLANAMQVEIDAAFKRD